MQPHPGDANLETWFSRWQGLFDSLDQRPEPSTMRSVQEMFRDELRKCGALTLKIDYYETLD
eukprot:12937014-Prorocentrum_lima.AAC.1